MDELSKGEFSRLRREMVEKAIFARGVRSELVLDAMRRVPRESFLPEQLREFAYEDAALPIEEGQTISQPYIVALMTEALALRGGEKVLEIGTGSGYAAAVLSEIAAEVYTVERHGPLAEKAAVTLADLGYDNVHVLHGDGTRGWPAHAPYDAIVVAAGGPTVPESLKSPTENWRPARDPSRCRSARPRAGTGNANRAKRISPRRSRRCTVCSVARRGRMGARRGGAGARSAIRGRRRCQ